MFLKKLKDIVNDYSMFKQLAIDLPWGTVSEEHLEWFHVYPTGIVIDLFTFPDGYLKEHFEDAYVRTIISSMAYYEEWDRDFWNTCQQERKNILAEAESCKKGNIYKKYITFKELRLKDVSDEYLEKEICYYAQKNNILQEEILRVLQYIKGAENIEIGGSYAGDHSYISIKENSVLCTTCGIWD